LIYQETIYHSSANFALAKMSLQIMLALDASIMDQDPFLKGNEMT